VSPARNFFQQCQGGPFVTLNCAAVPAELIESELFGHEKGSFTGAASRHLGKFEQANRGTLFLDEIGDMPILMQAKLLRVLEEGQVERVGGDRTIPVDGRAIVATHRNPHDLVKKGVYLTGSRRTLPSVRSAAEPGPDRALADWPDTDFAGEWGRERDRGFKGNASGLGAMAPSLWDASVASKGHASQFPATPPICSSRPSIASDQAVG